jgi:hypothetical protein
VFRRSTFDSATCILFLGHDSERHKNIHIIESGGGYRSFLSCSRCDSFHTGDGVLTYSWCSASCVLRLIPPWFGYFYSVLIKLKSDSPSFDILLYRSLGVLHYGKQCCIWVYGRSQVGKCLCMAVNCEVLR